mmetsp:Transcript_27012/g.68702  ORF Transcript_27012/g.68702 Transcript_27012/m.68702 type:complete len:315 (+) Transcript_27012:90-1034(+)
MSGAPEWSGNVPSSSSMPPGPPSPPAWMPGPGAMGAPGMMSGAAGPQGMMPGPGGPMMQGCGNGSSNASSQPSPPQGCGGAAPTEGSTGSMMNPMMSMMGGCCNPMMQMQMMAQMQQMQMMQMMMANPMMSMMNPMMQMGMAQQVPQEEEEERDPFLDLSEEELGQRINAQTVEAKEQERLAKERSPKGTFVGTLARYDPELGFGFVICPECVPQWGKNDIYIGQKNILESRLEIGDVISFLVEDNNGKPRVALGPKVLSDASEARRTLSRLKDAAKTVSLRNKRPAAMMVPSPVGPQIIPPPLKRMNLGQGYG